MRKICCRPVASERSIGVLALQGDHAAHRRMLAACGVASCEVRKPEQLAGLDGLILPGGESTTLLKLMENNRFEEALRDFRDAGGVLFGTCAGMILLARQVSDPEQRSLGLIDIHVARNAYGRQLDSFESKAEWAAAELFPLDSGGDTAAGTSGAADREDALPMVFIRAPKICSLGAGVESLARCRGDDVLVRQGHVLAASFHPEMADDLRVHQLFLRMATRRGMGEKEKGRLLQAGP